MNGSDVLCLAHGYFTHDSSGQGSEPANVLYFTTMESSEIYNGTVRRIIDIFTQTAVVLFLPPPLSIDNDQHIFEPLRIVQSGDTRMSQKFLSQDP